MAITILPATSSMQACSLALVAHKNLELEARILGDPDNVANFLAYGDWLNERRDPRGELVALQVRLEEFPNDETLGTKEAQLIGRDSEVRVAVDRLRRAALLCGEDRCFLAIIASLGWASGPPYDGAPLICRGESSRPSDKVRSCFAHNPKVHGPSGFVLESR